MNDSEQMNINDVINNSMVEPEKPIENSNPESDNTSEEEVFQYWWQKY